MRDVVIGMADGLTVPFALAAGLSGAVSSTHLVVLAGMAEIAAWAEAPARAIGRFDVCTPPKSLDEMWASASNESERQAIRTAMFGSVMDVVDRFLPDREKHAAVRSMLSFLAVNSTYLGPYTPGSALCLAFALASPTDATMAKVRGGIGTLSDHLLGLFEKTRPLPASIADAILAKGHSSPSPMPRARRSSHRCSTMRWPSITSCPANSRCTRTAVPR